MTRSTVLAVLAVFAPMFLSAILSGQAHAATQKIYSYLPADDATKKRIDSGLTFVFDKGLFGMKVKEVLATEAKARAGLLAVDDKDLGARLETVLPAGSFERDLYAVAAEDQGPAMVRAFCPGATKGWLVFGPMRARTDLTVHALGDDPKTGKARHCATLKFSFRGEWSVPLRGSNTGVPVPQDPMRSPW